MLPIDQAQKQENSKVKSTKGSLRSREANREPIPSNKKYNIYLSSITENLQMTIDDNIVHRIEESHWKMTISSKRSGKIYWIKLRNQSPRPLKEIHYRYLSQVCLYSKANQSNAARHRPVYQYPAP